MSKVFDINSFQLNIAKTGLFQENIVYFVSYFALTFEFISMTFLVFKKNIGVVLTFFMFVSFTIYIIFLQLLHRYEICGCGGILNGLSFEKHLIINLTLILFTFYLIKSRSKDEI
jgi:hypothetical protein